MGSHGKDSSEKISLLRNNLENKLSGKILDVATSFGELTITISDKAAAESFLLLRDNKECSFDTLVDLCGLDCSGLKEISEKFEARFCVVYHLLSTKNNQRLRVKLIRDGKFVPMWPDCFRWIKNGQYEQFLELREQKSKSRLNPMLANKASNQPF